MLSGLFGRSRSHKVPQELYGSVVAQSRKPVFFTDYGFADTVTDRFDLVSLHLFLFSRRLVREDTKLAQNLNQEVFDNFTDETDRALRELGVGDTSVPKRKKKMIRTFYALVENLGSPLDEEDENALKIQLRNRFTVKGEGDETYNTDALASYVLETARQLDEEPADKIMKGMINWPDPEKFI